MYSSASGGLSHAQDHAETCLPAHHASVGLRRLLKRHHLDERPHVGQYAEIQCVLHLDGASRQAAEQAPRPENQRHCADGHRVGSDANHDYLSSHLETGQERGNCFAGGSRSQDGIGATLTGSLEPGEIVTLEIPLPLTPYPIKVRAIVRYRQGLRYGFEFLTMNENQRDTIRRVCDYLATKS